MSAVKAAKLKVSLRRLVRDESLLGGGTGVRLHVDAPDFRVEVERLQGSLTAQVLEDVNVLIVSRALMGCRLADLVTTVVASAGETLRVLVGEDGSVGLHDGERGQVLPVRRDRDTRNVGHTSEAMSSKPEN